MTQKYIYFPYDPIDNNPSGKARGAASVEQRLQDFIAGTGRDCEVKTFIDPVMMVEITKMVQVDNAGQVATTHCSYPIDHPTLDARCYLIDDTEAVNFRSSLNDSDYLSAANKLSDNFTEKTKEELELLGFVFDI